jgi:adenylate kinase family enzyme
LQDTVEELMLEQLKASPKAKGFIIQGFPRDMEQAKQFDKLVSAIFFSPHPISEVVK